MLEEWVRRNRSGENGNIINSKRGKYILVILICLGLLALVWPVTNTEDTKLKVTSDPTPQPGGSNPKTQLCHELETILSQINGAGQVDVSMTLSSDGKKTFASNTRDEQRDIEENDSRGIKKKSTEHNLVRDLAVSSGNALMVEQEYPEVLGVLVVADGGFRPEVCENLIDATATLLNIPPHKVSVMPRKEDI
ncbi:MAG: hypothetical protein PHT79_03235 [Syntrophomonadaceae bacterium]|nr:hypothetical protein [Syntrophomonadaceae bacterium]MDD3888515.1 hypothetical protein [Syntrophomonadaceae bacterium]MDD4548755.1 hypothetical protein [Syntrophomonadaceae bacterium]